MFRRVSITMSTFIVLVVTSIFLTAIGSVFYAKYAYQHDREKLSVKIATASLRLSKAVIPAASSGDINTIRTVLKAFAATPEVSCVTLHLRKGNLVEYWPNEDCVQNNPGLFLHKQPIRRAMRVLGEAEVYFTDDFIREDIAFFVKEVEIGLSVLLVTMLGVMLALQRRLVTRPIKRITQAISRLGRGDLGARVALSSAPPELNSIAVSFNSMANDIAERDERLREQAAILEQTNKELDEKNTEINHSLNYASLIQNSLIHLDDPTPYGLEIHAVYDQLAQIGGDYFAGFDLGDRYVIFFADATGHGIPGAMATMMLAGALRDTLGRNPNADAATILSGIHRGILRSMSPDTIKTHDIALGADGSVLIFKAGSDEIQWASAKQPFLRVKSDGPNMVASDRKSIGYENVDKEFTLHRGHCVEQGEMFVMFSDGVTDMPGGPKGFGFGKKRIKAAAHTAYKRGANAEGTSQKILADIAAYQGDNDPFDDLSFLVIRKR